MNTWMKRTVRLWILSLLLPLGAAGQEKLARGDLTVKIHKAIDDTVLTIVYTAAEKMFIELFVVDPYGFFIDFPLSREIPAGEDSLKFPVGHYRTATYVIGWKINHDTTLPRVYKMFKHAQKGQRVTDSEEERGLVNKMSFCDGPVCKPADIPMIEKFLKDYPDYINRGKVFDAALLAYIQNDRDSALIHRTIDSLVAHIPGFYTYFIIARDLTGHGKLPSLAKKYFTMAHEAIGDTPVQMLAENRARLAEIEKKIVH